ncbi:MAG: hypothetical protein Tsb0010_17950 [Parvularculaceae bacterium]
MLVAIVAVIVTVSPRTPPPPSEGGVQRDILREPQSAQEAYCGCFDRARRYASSEGEISNIDGVAYQGGLDLCRNLRIFDSQNMGIHAWSMGWRSGAYDWNGPRPDALEEPPPRTCTQSLRLYRQSLRQQQQ